ncbi:MAG: topoisomerase 1 [Chlamydiota bacterium]|jgi:chromatin remodeling complex protein RSC6
MAKKKKVAKKKTTKRKAAPKKKVTKVKKKRTSKLMQTTYSLSAELQAVVGGRSMTRPEVVKRLWKYIKAHGCQDAKNRRMINPDKKLAEVIGSRPVDMLKLAGLLSKHIK